MKTSGIKERVGGTFVGIYKNNGQRMNAKVVKETPHYLYVVDNQNKRSVKMAKSSINYILANGRYFG